MGSERTASEHGVSRRVGSPSRTLIPWNANREFLSPPSRAWLPSRSAIGKGRTDAALADLAGGRQDDLARGGIDRNPGFNDDPRVTGGGNAIEPAEYAGANRDAAQALLLPAVNRLLVVEVINVKELARSMTLASVGRIR
jgi:hypothetical protein